MKIQPYRYDFIFEPDEKGDKRTNQEVEAASKNHINCFIKSDLKTKYSSKLALS
jgi:hypothetical protein